MVGFVCTHTPSLWPHGCEAGKKLNINGLYNQYSVCLDGRTIYKVGGRFTAKLVFTLESDGATSVQKYSPGSWESTVVSAYERAQRVEVHLS